MCYLTNMSAQRLLELYKVEINSHDFSRVEPLLSSECKFWFSSGTFEGIEQTRKAFEKTWSMIQEEVYSIYDLVWLSQDTCSAACTYTFHWKGLINGELSEGKGRGTTCFRVENGQWKIVHEHLSRFP